MTPGSNLLAQALRIIAPTDIYYRKFTGRVQNSQAQFISAFGDPLVIGASVQRVPRTQYIQYGLEFQRNYVNVYASQDMVDLDRDTSGDQFAWGGKLWQLESQGTWFVQDGWALCLAVDIGQAVGSLDEDGKPVINVIRKY